MSVINNLADVRIDSVSLSAIVNLGNSIQVNPSNNLVSLGRAIPIGDYSLNAGEQKNVYIDPDLFSQISKG
jgi:hypothetical protein